MEKTSGERLQYGELTYAILGAAIEVHRALGPGLLESAYRACLVQELSVRGLPFEQEKAIAIDYKGLAIQAAYRADLVVDGKVLVELKAVERLEKVHDAQILTYLRLSGLPVGLLLNFNATSLKHSMRRFVRRDFIPKPSVDLRGVPWISV